MNGSFFRAYPRRCGATHMPLTVLHACHQRILRQCRTLRRLAVHITDRGQSLDAQMASHTLLRFFDNEVPQHCMDEEQHLFPALIDSMAGSDAVCLRALANGSMERHQVLAAQWERLRGSLEHIAAGRLILLPRNEVEAFAAAWTGHVDVEEAELLPMASRLLSDDELVALYRRMQG